jgi:hypothetical protein
VPIFVRNGANAGKGNSALLNRGGKPWPNPQSGNELGRALVAAAEAITAEPKQDTLPLTLREEPKAYEAAPVAKLGETVSVKDETALIDVKLSPEAGLLNTVREILRRELAEARTEEEVAILLGVTKSQAKAWLAHLVEEAVIEKVKKSKPARFCTVINANRLI